MFYLYIQVWKGRSAKDYIALYINTHYIQIKKELGPLLMRGKKLQLHSDLWKCDSILLHTILYTEAWLLKYKLQD